MSGPATLKDLRVRLIRAAGRIGLRYDSEQVMQFLQVRRGDVRWLVWIDVRWLVWKDVRWLVWIDGCSYSGWGLETASAMDRWMATDGCTGQESATLLPKAPTCYPEGSLTDDVCSPHSL